MRRILRHAASLVMALCVALCSACNKAQPEKEAAIEADRKQLEAEKKQFQEDRRAFEEERRQFQKARDQAATRPLGERLVGNWAADDPKSDLRGITFAKDGSATVSSVLLSDDKEPVHRAARYRLVGKSLNVEVLLAGSFVTGPNTGGVTADFMSDVVKVTDQELVIRRKNGFKNGRLVPNDKEERFVRP
jgi:hypothetical protein